MRASVVINNVTTSWKAPALAIITPAFYDSDDTLSHVNSAIVAPVGEITYRRNFVDDGIYSVGFLIQDIVTGAVEYQDYDNYNVYV